MKPARLLLVLPFVIGVPRLSSQSPSRQPPTDPVFAKIIETQPLYRDAGTRRLEILTQIWGDVGLYHPVPSAERLKWDNVLVEAVRQLGTVSTERGFANLINRVIFAPLHDPLIYAITRAENDSVYSFPIALTTRTLAPGVAYVSAVDRGYSQRDFLIPFRKVLDSVTARPDTKRLLIDLRSTSAAPRPGAPGAWLGMWLRQTVRTGQQISIIRTTAEGIGQVQWVVGAKDSLASIGPQISVPTVFIVNRTSYAAVERALDAVRSSRPEVAVVFEEGGPIPNLGYNSFQVFYPDSILLPHYHTVRISADGGLGTVVDRRVPRGVPLGDLAGISDRALAARVAQPSRSAFTFENSTVTDDRVSMGPLTREQRIAGLMKIWFSVGRFYAFPDDITGDWRRMPAAWLPRIEAAADDRAYYRLLRQVSVLLNDTHSDVAHPLSPGFLPGGVFLPPIRLDYVQNRVSITLVDTSEASIGVKPGDEVLGIDGRTIKEVESGIDQYLSTSKLTHRVPPRFFVAGPKDSLVTLTVRSTGGVHDVTLPRSRQFAFAQSISGNQPAFAILPGNIGYMNLGTMDTPARFDSAMAALANSRGMILDNRNAYPPGFDFRRFITDPQPWMMRVESVSSLYDDYSPTMAFGGPRSWVVPSTNSTPAKYTKPVVVIINNYLISRGETLAQLFRVGHRAVFVGETTNGTYGSKEGVTIPGGAVFNFSTGRALFPNGDKYHGIGVVPEVPVSPTIAGLRAGKDEVYDRAVATLNAILAGKRFPSLGPPARISR